MMDSSPDPMDMEMYLTKPRLKVVRPCPHGPSCLSPLLTAFPASPQLTRRPDIPDISPGRLSTT